MRVLADYAALQYTHDNYLDLILFFMAFRSPAEQACEQSQDILDREE